MPVCTTKTPEADVTGLNEGKDYLFRVKAVNPEGESEALVTDTATTAKNPYGEFDLLLILKLGSFFTQLEISNGEFNFIAVWVI